MMVEGVMKFEKQGGIWSGWWIFGGGIGGQGGGHRGGARRGFARAKVRSTGQIGKKEGEIRQRERKLKGID